MKIGTIEAGAGEKAYGQFKTGETHGRFPVHIPLHIINGAQDGPTLVVQSGLSGLEIEPALILPQIVKELDPAHIKGTVVVVPLMNTSGFEFTQIVSAWDGKHLNKLGRGNLNGTISEQMIAQYYDAVINPADALLDIRSGSQWAYNRYAGIYSAGEADKSQAMAVATGLPQVVTGQAADGSLAYEAATDGKAVTVANIGGGPGLRDYRADDMARNRRAVLNTMRHLGMLDGDMEYEAGTITVIEAHTIIMPELFCLPVLLRGARDRELLLDPIVHTKGLECIACVFSAIVTSDGARLPVTCHVLFDHLQCI
ncbi:MAG: succinylglutamate desuccinylase/aspartoacylase family protein [Chloroflexota bacterium]